MSQLCIGAVELPCLTKLEARGSAWLAAVHSPSASEMMLIQLPAQHLCMQLDPKEIARKRAAAAKAEAKAVSAAKEAATMKKLSSFFKPIAKAG